MNKKVFIVKCENVFWKMELLVYYTSNFLNDSVENNKSLGRSSSPFILLIQY